MNLASPKPIASTFLNFKYNLSNFEFPLFDYFKNYGHNSTFQVIPSLNPIYFLSFMTDVENVITIQKILENFIFNGKKIIFTKSKNIKNMIKTF